MRFLKSFLLLTISFLLFSFFKNKEGNKKIIMALFAHPDDEIDITPALSKYAKEGHTVYLVFATRGEKGPSKRETIAKGDSLAAARTKEAVCACEKLGIHPPIFLDLEDAALVKEFTGKPIKQKLDSLFSLYAPDVLITWGPDGGYGHSDHRMIGNVATEIFQSGKIQYPKLLYFTGIPKENFDTYPVPKTKDGKWLYDNWKPVKKEFLTVRIKCSREDIEQAIHAMDCYKTQFTDEEMEDNHKWLLHMNNDSVYLRPFIPQTKISFTIFKE